MCNLGTKIRIKCQLTKIMTTFALMKIGIIVAMEKEFAQLQTLLDERSVERHNHKDFVIGSIGDKQVIMQQCGIGKVNAAIGAVEMIDQYHPDLLISTGVAGGADASMNPLDVVAGIEYRYHDVYCGSNVEYGQFVGMPPCFHSPEELIEKARQCMPNEGSRMHIGQMVSGDWFVDTKDKMRSILEKFPDAKAVDMESCSIAQVCYVYKVPFISFRIISDVPLKDEKAAQYFDFWNRMAEGSFNVTKEFLVKL